MDFRQLEVFAAVIELSSFSRAGERLYLSQPTVSAHVSSLEKELGVPLIIRNTREIYPSEAGQKLYDYAVKLLRLRDEFRTKARDESLQLLMTDQGEKPTLIDRIIHPAPQKLNVAFVNNRSPQTSGWTY